MKKILSILLAVCTLVCAFSLNAFAATTTDEIVSCYDFNGDGSVNLTDARTVLRVSAGLEAPREGFVYDLDGDGLSTITDVKMVLSIVLGVDVEITSDEFNLGLFRAELNNIKAVRPGFTKTATTKCDSMLVTTRNAPDASLNVTNMPFDQYTNKTCDYLEDTLEKIDNPIMGGILGGLGGISKEDIAEMKASIAAMRKQADELYTPKTTTTTVAKRRSHYAAFPVNNLANSCFLTMDDIKSIECYEENGYIIRKVTMNEDTYIGDEYPTGYEGSSQRWQKISYGKVFNIPEFSETENGKETSRLNKVTFKNGVIISKIDKLSGIPVSVEYSYTYVADVSTIPTVDANGNPGLEMDSVTTAKITESYVINPVTNN